MNLSANFSRFREYSISISDFLRKKSCRSWRSCTLISVCCSRHFCCSTSWARISKKRRTCHSSQWKQMRTEHYQLNQIFQSTSASAATAAAPEFQVLWWDAAPMQPWHTSASACCVLPPAAFLSQMAMARQGLRTLLGSCKQICLYCPLPSFSQPLALARHLARSSLLVGGGVQLFEQQLLLLPWKTPG